MRMKQPPDLATIWRQNRLSRYFPGGLGASCLSTNPLNFNNSLDLRELGGNNRKTLSYFTPRMSGVQIPYRPPFFSRQPHYDPPSLMLRHEIGRASCRERVCKYV